MWDVRSGFVAVRFVNNVTLFIQLYTTLYNFRKKYIGIMNYNSYKIFAHSFLCKLIKTLLFSVYLLSSTPFYIIYLFLLLLALFSEMQNNLLTIFSQYFIVGLIFSQFSYSLLWMCSFVFLFWHSGLVLLI